MFIWKTNELELYLSCEICLPANAVMNIDNHTDKLKSLTIYVLSACSGKNWKKVIHFYQFKWHGLSLVIYFTEEGCINFKTRNQTLIFVISVNSLTFRF